MNSRNLPGRPKDKFSPACASGLADFFNRSVNSFFEKLLNFIFKHLDAKVGRSPSIKLATRIIILCFGGSSKTFSRELAALAVSFSAWLIIRIFSADSLVNEVLYRGLTAALIVSSKIESGFPSSLTIKRLSTMAGGVGFSQFPPIIHFFIFFFYSKF